MSVLTVQLNHPGAEKVFRLGDGYSYMDDRLIHEWNADNSHYRKFMRQEGQYIYEIGQKPTSDELLFWGEWEGYSYFEPLNRHNPNGIHQPFHATHMRHHQNTDPYIFGKNFLYAVCKQRGRLTQLVQGSMVLFGSSFKKGFVLDTVCVVGSYESVQDVALSNAAEYTRTYRESTLEQLGDTYFRPSPASKLRLYKDLMYAENQELFSYTPCKLFNELNSNGFPRVIFPYEKLVGFQFSNNLTGIKILSTEREHTEKVWKFISQEVLNQGFYLGTQITEPT